MSIIETLEDAFYIRCHELSEKATESFRKSVRSVIASENGKKPKIIGTCLLIEIDSKRYAVTAAHIIDNLDTHSLYISGSIGTEPIQILGKIYYTNPPSGDRKLDKIDIAYWEINEPTAQELGDVEFINSSRFSYNQAILEYRIYLAMGFPISRNKKNVKNTSKSIMPSLSRYTAELFEDEDITRDLSASGKRHLFLKLDDRTRSFNGEERDMFDPRGLSGGPLIDLGSFSSLEKYDENLSQNAFLAGMIIERSKKHKALVAIRVQVIEEALPLKILEAECNGAKIFSPQER